MQENLAQYQTAGRKGKIPDHFIRAVSRALNGINPLARDYLPDLALIYSRQGAIGWRNFLKGRISKAWSCMKPPREARMSSQEWLRRLVRFVLKGLLMKWKTRCEIVSGATNTREKDDLLDEARDLWKTTTTTSYLAQDSHLADKEQEPKDAWTPTSLRNWIQTRVLAIDTAKKLSTKRQRLITSWLPPRVAN